MSASKAKLNLLAIAGAMLSIFLTSVSHAQLACEDLFKPPHEQKFQSSVEVEIGATPKVIELFTTDDDSIRPVVGDAGQEAIEPEILRELQDFVGAENDPLDAPWDLLTPQEKIQIIQKSAELRSHSFKESRVVPGLKYRDRIELEFKDYTFFLGRVFSPGKYSFSKEELFGPTKIEYMGANRMKENLGFELHIRSALKAGSTKLTSEAFQKALIGKTQNVHQHIVAPYPDIKERTTFERALIKFKKFLGFNAPDTTDPIKVVQLAEFVRRTNLYFDIKMIENGTKMIEVKAPGENNGSNFFPSVAREFSGFVNTIWARSGLKGLGFSKAGALGVRSKAYYDQDVWGIEIRYLSPRLQSRKTADVINFVQSKMVSGEFFISPDEAAAYYKKFAQNDSMAGLTNVAESLSYSSFRRRRMKHDSPEAAAHFALFDKIEENDFIKMLYHDWSDDPMFAGNSVRVSQIIAAQKYCRELIDRGQDSSEVMKIFIKKSGIGYEINQFFEGSHS